MSGKLGIEATFTYINIMKNLLIAQLRNYIFFIFVHSLLVFEQKNLIDKHYFIKCIYY